MQMHAGMPGTTVDRAAFRLPFLFIVTGMIGFVTFHLFTLVGHLGWIDDAPRNPVGWSHVHLILLGWATMVAMGAVYQLISVILQSNVYSRKLGFIQYALFTLGVAGLVVGFRQFQTGWIAAFALLTFTGILLFTCNIGQTLRLARSWNPITLSVASALIYLLLAGGTGLTMGIGFATGWDASFRLQLLTAHLWLGAVGWFGLLITGFSYKLLSMFHLAHQVPTRKQKVVWFLWNLGVITGVTASILDAPLGHWLGGGLITSALIAYSLHLKEIRKHAIKKHPGPGIAFTQWSAHGVTLIAVLFLISAPWLSFEDPRLQLILGWIYLYGWVGMTILGYLSKIVPFLWWTYKYGVHAGKPSTPTLGDLINQRWIGITLKMIGIALLLMTAGIAIPSEMFTVLAGAVLSLSSLAYITWIALVFVR